MVFKKTERALGNYKIESRNIQQKIKRQHWGNLLELKGKTGHSRGNRENRMKLCGPTSNIKEVPERTGKIQRRKLTSQ